MNNITMYIIVFIWFILVQVYCIPDRHEEHKGIPNYFLMEDHSPSLHVRVDIKGSKVIANPAGMFVTTESHPGHSHSLAGGGTSRSAVSRRNTSLSGVKRDFATRINKHAFHRKLPVDHVHFGSMFKNHTIRSKLYRTEKTGHDTVQIHHKSTKAKRRLMIAHTTRDEVPLTKSLNDGAPPHSAAPIARLFNITKSTIADFNSADIKSAPISKIKLHRKKNGEVEESDDKKIPDFNTINTIKVEKVHHDMFDDTNILEPNEKKEETFVFQKVVPDASNDSKLTDPNTTKMENVHHHKGEAQNVSVDTKVPEPGKVENVNHHKSEALDVFVDTKVPEPDTGKAEKVRHRKHEAQNVPDYTSIIDTGTKKEGKVHQKYEAQDVSDDSRIPELNKVVQDDSTYTKLSDPNTTKVEKVHHHKGEAQDVSDGTNVSEPDTGKVENVHHKKLEAQYITDNTRLIDPGKTKMENVNQRYEAQDVSDDSRIPQRNTTKIGKIHYPMGKGEDDNDDNNFLESNTGKVETVHHKKLEGQYISDNKRLIDPGTTMMENVNQRYEAQDVADDSRIPQRNTTKVGKIHYPMGKGEDDYDDNKLLESNTGKMETVHHKKNEAQADSAETTAPTSNRTLVENVYYQKDKAKEDSDDTKMAKPNKFKVPHNNNEAQNVSDDADPETIKVSSIVTTWSNKPSKSKEKDLNPEIKEDELVNTKVFNETTTLKNGQTIEHSFSLKNKNFSITTQANFFDKEKTTNNESSSLKDARTGNESVGKGFEKLFDDEGNNEKVTSQNFHAKSRKEEENRIEKQNELRLIEKFKPRLVEIDEKDNSSSQQDAGDSVNTYSSDDKEKQRVNEFVDVKKPNFTAHKKQSTVDGENVTQMNQMSNDSSSSNQNATITPMMNTTMHLLTEKKLNATKAVISDVLDAVKEELFLRLHSTGTLKLLNRSGEPDLAKQILNESIGGNETSPMENISDSVKLEYNMNKTNESINSFKTEENKGSNENPETIFIRGHDILNSDHSNETNANKSLDKIVYSKNFSNLSSDPLHNKSVIKSDEASSTGYSKFNKIENTHENSTTRSSESTSSLRSTGSEPADQVIWEDELRNGGKEVEPKFSTINVDPAAEDLYGHENVLHSIHEDYGNSDYSDIQIDYHADPVSHNVEGTGGLAYNHMDILPHYRRGRSKQYRESDHAKKFVQVKH